MFFKRKDSEPGGGAFLFRQVNTTFELGNKLVIYIAGLLDVSQAVATSDILLDG